MKDANFRLCPAIILKVSQLWITVWLTLWTRGEGTCYVWFLTKAVVSINNTQFFPSSLTTLTMTTKIQRLLLESTVSSQIWKHHSILVNLLYKSLIYYKCWFVLYVIDVCWKNVWPGLTCFLHLCALFTMALFFHKLNDQFDRIFKW